MPEQIANRTAEKLILGLMGNKCQVIKILKV